MWGVGVLGMRFAAGPDFVEQEGGGAFGGAMQIVGEASVFFARRADERAQLSFEEHFLPIAWAELDDKGYSVFGEFGALGRPGFEETGRAFLCFALRHSGRDSTPRGPENPNSLAR